jgi:hypothetical protein
MPCPQCGAENELGAVICGECGARLIAVWAQDSADIGEKAPPWLQELLIRYDLVKPEQQEEKPPAIRKRKVVPPAVEEPDQLPALVEPTEESGAQFTDWLQDLRSQGEDWEQQAAGAQGPLPSTDQDVTDWMRGLQESVTEVETELPDTVSRDEEEAPDWLHDQRELSVEAEPVPSPEEVSPPVERAETEDTELPDWLRELGEVSLQAEEEPLEVQIPPPGEPSATLVPGEEELPEWLARMQEEPAEEETIISPAEAASSPEAPALEEPEDLEVPEWLREVRELEVPAEKEASPAWVTDLDVEDTGEREPSEAPTVRPGEVEDQEDEEMEAPQWLQELQEMQPAIPAEEPPVEVTSPPDWLTQPPVSPLPEMEADAKVPPWFEESEPPTEMAEKDVPPLTDVEGEEPGEALEPPVLEVPTEGLAEPSAEPIIRAEEEPEGLVRADIPDWLLALRPREPGAEPVEEQEIVELSGPLAGIRGVLPVEPLISLPHLTRPEAVKAKTPSVSGDLFAEIVAQPPMPTTAEPRRVELRRLAGIQRVLIYLLLLTAIVVPIVAGPVFGPLDAKDLWAGAGLFYAVLDGRGGVALPEGAPVIVAFDYNPATAAELSLQARAIVDHLMRRGVRIMAISLYPEGAALAGDILDELAAEQAYTYGEHYIHLGYLPNQPASVRHLLNVGPAGQGQYDYRNGRPVGEYVIAQGVNDLSSVSLVVELAGDVSTLRAWVEQIAARADVPVVGGVSAATAPYVRPYLESGQLRALLVGLPGAAEYEAQLGRSGKAIDSLGSQAAAQAVVVLLILLGNLVHLVTRGGKK